MKSELIKLLYNYLCPQCSEDWLGCDIVKLCESCNSIRFPHQSIYTLELLYKSINKYVFTYESSRLIIKGPALLLFRSDYKQGVLPTPLEAFNDYQNRVYILLGRFFTLDTFIPINPVEFSYNGSNHQYHYVRKFTPTD